MKRMIIAAALLLAAILNSEVYTLALLLIGAGWLLRKLLPMAAQAERGEQGNG